SEGARFDDSMTVRLPASIPQAVKRAAARRGQKDAEYVRAALVSALKADGIEPEQPSASAGELYDVVDGRKRFAKIEAGIVTSMS
ncbi:hypothetical protein V3G65_25840, partial [Escherichia coli]|uniref:hypothetical protein n=1 Tax=Escherichia coli TaxID=562 RepID=UPI003593C671